MNVTPILTLLAACLAVSPASAQNFTIRRADPPITFSVKQAPSFVIVPQTRTYGDMRAESIKANKPLVVWIGYKCPSSAAQVPGMLHHHVTAEEWYGYKGPGVVVGVPDGKGELKVAAFIAASNCCATNIRDAVERTLKGWETTNSAPAIMFQHVRGWAASMDGNCRG